MLSGGGTDSSALLAAAVAWARGAQPREVHAVALDFGGHGDDWPYIAALTRALGIVPLRVGASAVLPRFFRSLVVDATPIPFATFAWIAAAMSVARQHGARLTLQGMAGDELFDGHPDMFAARVRRGDLGAIVEAVRLRGAYYSANATPWKRIEYSLLRPLARAAMPRRVVARWRARRRHPALAWAGPKLRAYLERASEGGGEPAMDTSERLAAHFCSNYALDVFDVRGCLEIAADCESAAPYADPELVDFISRVSPEAFFAGGYFRGLLREAMRGLVPDEVRLRSTKWAPPEALGELFRLAGGAAALAPFTKMSALSDLGLVEPKPFAERFADFAHRADARGWTELWPAIAAEALISAASPLASTLPVRRPQVVRA